MSAKKNASPRVLGSNLTKMDAHQIRAPEYDDLPELTDDMIARAVVDGDLSLQEKLRLPEADGLDLDIEPVRIAAREPEG